MDGSFVNERWIFAVFHPARFHSYVMWLLHKCLVGGNNVQRGKKVNYQTNYTMNKFVNLVANELQIWTFLV